MRRKNSLRLENYDYTKEGSYFITIVTQNKNALLGEIREDEMLLNEAGEMIEIWIKKLSSKFMGIGIESMVIMPNHIHFILIKEEGSKENTLSKIVQWFKTMTTNAYIKGVRAEIYMPFDKKLWQRNYYEHIIRDENSYHEIREYIQNNPQKWKEDSLYA